MFKVLRVRKAQQRLERTLLDWRKHLRKCQPKATKYGFDCVHLLKRAFLRQTLEWVWGRWRWCVNINASFRWLYCHIEDRSLWQIHAEGLGMLGNCFSDWSSTFVQTSLFGAVTGTPLLMNTFQNSLFNHTVFVITVVSYHLYQCLRMPYIFGAYYFLNYTHEAYAVNICKVPGKGHYWYLVLRLPSSLIWRLVT